MSVHVAILLRRYADLVLAGRKTVESRLYRTPMPPLGCANTGERVYIKVSSGPFVAVAHIAKVDEYNNVTPDLLDVLTKRYNQTVCGDADYWHSKRNSRFAIFITLRDVEPIDVGPTYPKSMRAWHTLDDKWDVIREFEITPGALRNSYLRSPRFLTVDSYELLLPDGITVQTQLAANHMFGWRGWGRYYEQHNLRPGDRVRFVALGGRRYRVSFVPTRT